MSHFISAGGGCLGSDGWPSLSVHQHPLLFPMVQGVGPPPAAAKRGFLFSSSGLTPTPSFLYL